MYKSERSGLLAGLHILVVSSIDMVVLLQERFQASYTLPGRPLVFRTQSMRGRFNAGSEQSKNSVSVTVSLILELVVPMSVFADTRRVEG